MLKSSCRKWKFWSIRQKIILTDNVVPTRGPVNDVFRFANGNVINGVAGVICAVTHFNRHCVVRVRRLSRFVSDRLPALVLVARSADNVFPAGSES